jgi:hypothetical protein
MTIIGIIPNAVYQLNSPVKQEALELFYSYISKDCQRSKKYFERQYDKISVFAKWEQSDCKGMLYKVTYTFVGEFMKKLYLRKTQSLPRTYSHEDLRGSPCTDGVATLILYRKGNGEYQQINLELSLKIQMDKVEKQPAKNRSAFR